MILIEVVVCIKLSVMNVANHARCLSGQPVTSPSIAMPVLVAKKTAPEDQIDEILVAEIQAGATCIKPLATNAAKFAKFHSGPPVANQSTVMTVLVAKRIKGLSETKREIKVVASLKTFSTVSTPNWTRF